MNIRDDKGKYIQRHPTPNYIREKISAALKRNGVRPLLRYDATGKTHKPEWFVKMRATCAIRWPGVLKNCAICDTRFRVSPIRTKTARFCSVPCANKAMDLGQERRRLVSTHYTEVRRARKVATMGQFTLDQWIALKKQFGNVCPACWRSEPEIKLSVDHIVPLAKGGIHDISNIQPLCRSCNCRKSTAIIQYIH